MDFLANENFPLSSVRFLREAGHRRQHYSGGSGEQGQGYLETGAH